MSLLLSAASINPRPKKKEGDRRSGGSGDGGVGGGGGGGGEEDEGCMTSFLSWLRGRHTGSQSDRPLVKTDDSCVAEGAGRIIGLGEEEKELEGAILSCMTPLSLG